VKRARQVFKDKEYVEVNVQEAKKAGCIINLLSSSHPHFRSFLSEGLWGFPDNRVNRKKWSILRPGCETLLYFEHKGVRGVWGLGKVVEVFESRKPVSYWVRDPAGFPLQVRLELIEPKNHRPVPSDPVKLDWFNGVTPLRREELAGLNVKMPGGLVDRWSLIVLGEGTKYSYSVFEQLKYEFLVRNKEMRLAPSRSLHEEIKQLIAEIGRMQRKYVSMEEEIEGKRIDVSWRRIERGVPYAVFEVCIGGDLYADLVKLKHAVDMWNSIAVLITTEDKVEEARKWVEGAFHEVAQYFRILTVEDVRKLYESKRNYKMLEAKYGLV
jgi:hypothetical protein